jgi:predicted MPP superfamily phosphohydrolase/CheY-like chemotaxis protein
MKNLLVVDDRPNWREFIVEAFQVICNCATASTYDDAVEKIATGEYSVICQNWEFHSVNNTRKILTLLKTQYPEIPVVLISGNPEFTGDVSRIQQRTDNIKEQFPNVKSVILKGGQNPASVLPDLLEAVSTILLSQPQVIQEAKNDQGRKVISWLHLSDLHIGCNKGDRDWEKLKDALVNDIQVHQEAASEQKGHLAGAVFRPHVIVITGDVAYRGAKGEYDEAGELLDSIRGIVGLRSEETFIVPGNHDVKRAIVESDPFFEVVYNELADSDLGEKDWRKKVKKWWSYPSFRELLVEKFSEYLQFARRNMAATLDLGYYVKPVVVSGFKVDILGLNSAVMSWKDKEDLERGLCIGEPQLDEIEKHLSSDASFRIALVHHPREALHYQDVAWSRLQEISHVILHGHLHRLKVIATGEPQHEHLCLPGGSVYQGGVWYSQRYSYGELDLQTGKLDLYLRMTKPGAYPEYIQDNQTYHRSAPDGHLTINLPQKS